MLRMNIWLLVAFVAPLLLSSLIQRSSLPFLCDEGSGSRDKYILITGASTGIGKQLALDYSKLNASLVIVARKGHLLAATAKECTALGARNVVSVVGDVTDNVDQIVEAVKDSFQGRLDLAILNHAVVPSAMLSENTDYAKHLNEVFTINTMSIVKLSQAILPYLEIRSGSVVGMGSGGQFVPQLFLSAYSISKVALQTYFDHLRVERSAIGSKVSVQYIVLGEIATEMMLEKRQNQSLWYSPWLVSPEFVSKNIICVIHRKLSYSFVPSYTYFITWVGEILRPVWTIVSEWAWVYPKPDLRERLEKSREAFLGGG